MQQHTDPAYLQISLNPYAQFHMQDVTTHNHQEVNLTIPQMPSTHTRPLLTMYQVQNLLEHHYKL